MPKCLPTRDASRLPLVVMSTTPPTVNACCHSTTGGPPIGWPAAWRALLPAGLPEVRRRYVAWSTARRPAVPATVFERVRTPASAASRSA